MSRILSLDEFRFICVGLAAGLFGWALRDGATLTASAEWLQDRPWFLSVFGAVVFSLVGSLSLTAFERRSIGAGQALREVAQVAALAVGLGVAAGACHHMMLQLMGEEILLQVVLGALLGLAIGRATGLDLGGAVSERRVLFTSAGGVLGGAAGGGLIVGLSLTLEGVDPLHLGALGWSCCIGVVAFATSRAPAFWAVGKVAFERSTHVGTMKKHPGARGWPLQRGSEVLFSSDPKLGKQRGTIFIPDSEGVARRHAVIRVDAMGAATLAREPGSGGRVLRCGGRDVRAPVRLRDGDPVQIGSSTFRVEIKTERIPTDTNR